MGVVSSRTFQWNFDDQATSKMKAAREEIKSMVEEIKNVMNTSSTMDNGFSQSSEKIKSDIKGIEDQLNSLKNSDSTKVSISAEDKTKDTFEKVKNEAENVKKESSSINISAKDDTETTFNKVKREASDMNHEKANINVDAHDKTGSVFDKIKAETSKLVHGNNDIKLKAKDDVSPTLAKISEHASETKGKISSMIAAVAGGNIAANALTTIANGAKEVVTSGYEAAQEADTFKQKWSNIGIAKSGVNELSEQLESLKENTDISEFSIAKLQTKFYDMTGSVSQAKTLTNGVASLADKLRLTGSNADNFSQSLMRVESGGTLTSNTFNRLERQAPGLGTAMQQASGMSTKAFTALINSGKMTSTQFNQILTKASADYKKNSSGFSETSQGAMHKLKQTWEDTKEELMTPLVKISATGLTDLNKALDNKATKEAIEELGTGIAHFANYLAKAVAIAATFSGAINDAMEVVSSVFKSVFSVIGVLLSTFKMSLEANVVNPIKGGSIKEALENFKKGFEDVANAVKPIAVAVGGLAGVIGGAAISTALSLIHGIAKGFEDVFNNGKKASSINFSSLSGTITKISQALARWLQPLQPIAKYLGEIIAIIAGGAFKGAASVFNAIVKAFSSMATNAVKVSGPLTPIAKGLEAISKQHSALETVGKVVGSLAASFLAVRGALLVFAGAMKVVQVAMAAFSAVMKVVDFVMSMNPFVLAAIAIAAIGAAFYEAYKHITPFRDAVNKVAKETISGLTTAWNWVKKNWVGLALLIVNPIAGGLKLLYDNNSGFRKWANDLWEGVKDGFSSGVKSLEKDWNSFTKDWDKLWSGIFKSAESAWNGFAKDWNKLWSGIEKASEIVWNGLKKLAGLAFKSIEYTALAPIVLLASLIVATWKLIEKPTLAAWNLIKQYIVKPIEEAYRGVVSGLNMIYKFMLSAWKEIEKGAQIAWNLIKQYIIKPIQDVYKGIVSGLNMIYKFMLSVWKEIEKITEVAWNLIYQYVIKPVINIYNQVVKWFNNLFKAIENIWNEIKKITSNIWNAISDWIVNKAQSIWNGIVNVFNHLKNDIENIWNEIKQITSNVWNAISSWVVNKATDIWHDITGVFNSLKKDISNILDAINDKWQTIWSGIKSFFGDIWTDIKSMAKDGLNGVIGFLNGGIDGIDKVIHFFGGAKKTISDIPKLAKGGSISKPTLAVVNDQKGSTYREAIVRNNGNVEIPKGRNVLAMLDAGDSVIPAGPTESIFGNTPHFASGTSDWFEKMWNGAKGMASDVADDVSDAVDELADAIKNPSKILNQIISKVTNSAGGVFNTMAADGGKYLMNSATSWFKKTLEKLNDDVGSAGNPSGSGVMRWKSYIKKAAEAMKINDLSDTEVNKILKVIQNESNGDPTVTQKVWDINMASGNPAIGLLQFVPSTFASYAVKGHTNIRNGYDQLLAMFNDSNYEHDVTTGGWGPSGHRRFDSGGWINTPETIDVAEHTPEVVINPTKSNAISLATQALSAISERQPGLVSSSLTSSNSSGISEELAEKVLKLLGIIADNTNGSLSVEDLNSKLDNINLKKLSTLTATS